MDWVYTTGGLFKSGSSTIKYSGSTSIELTPETTTTNGPAWYEVVVPCTAGKTMTYTTDVWLSSGAVWSLARVLLMDGVEVLDEKPITTANAWNQVFLVGDNTTGTTNRTLTLRYEFQMTAGTANIESKVGVKSE
jgi:hypothetical protein